jgi:hypothetical protein
MSIQKFFLVILIKLKQNNHIKSLLYFIYKVFLLNFQHILACFVMIFSHFVIFFIICIKKTANFSCTFCLYIYKIKKITADKN